MDQKARWRERTREWALNYLGGRCIKCQTRLGLQFDHIVGTDKNFAISEGIRNGYSRSRLRDELTKCQLLCSTHHREKTIQDGQHAGGHNRVDSPQHGTAVMYGRERCRCPECRQWKVNYRAKRVDSRGCSSGV